MKVFISGSISIKVLNEIDLSFLDYIIAKRNHILIGDAFGVDKLVQEYLYEKKYSNVTVYFSSETVRNNVGNWQTRPIANPDKLTAKAMFQLKDYAMAADCDSGFMFWDGKSTGTKHNMDTLDKLDKIYVYVENGEFRLSRGLFSSFERSVDGTLSVTIDRRFFNIIDL